MTGELTARRLLEAACPCRILQASGITPHGYQRAFLHRRARRELLCWSRQSGKSQAVAARALFEALHRAPAFVVVSSFAERQSGELLLKIRDLLRPLEDRFPLVSDAALSLRFANGSRILALPGRPASPRSLSDVDLVVLDEAAWTSDELFHAIVPVLAASDGDLVALSSAPEEEGLGWYWREWTNEGRISFAEAPTTAADEWHRTLVTALDVPHLSRRVLDEQRRRRPRVFDREFMCVPGRSREDAKNPRIVQDAKVLDELFV